MATKTANVLARVEPDVKEQAEAIMAKLGVPASTVINMLYKQIILTRSIPFALSVPSAPIAYDEMDTAAFVTFAQAAERTGRSSVSLEGYYRSVIKRQSQYMDLEMILDLIGKEMAPYVSGEVQAALMEYAHLCIENGKENQTEKDEKECIRMDSIVEVLDSLGELDRRIIRGSFEEYPDIWEWLERIDLSRLKECAGKRSIRIWGAYKRSEYLKMKLEQAGFTVSGFIDKAYAQKEFCGKEVIGPADALDARKREYIMIPLIREYEEILAWLNQYKYEPAKDFLYFGREGKEEIRHE